MSSPEMLEPLLGPVAAVQRLIERLNDRGVIIGGVAASLLGQPRLTADADALVLLSVEEVPRLVDLAQAEGLYPRLSDVVDFARRSRVILLRHEESGIHVDISLGVLPFEVETVERSQEYQAGSLTVRLPSPEDLIIFKNELIDPDVISPVGFPGRDLMPEITPWRPAKYGRWLAR